MGFFHTIFLSEIFTLVFFDSLKCRARDCGRGITTCKKGVKKASQSFAPQGETK